MIKNKLNFLKINTFLFVLAFSSATFAGFIPSSLFGDAETGSETWKPTDILTGYTDTEFDLLSNFGDADSDNTFGLYLLNNNNQIESSLQIFGNNGVGTGTTLWDYTNKNVQTQFGFLDFSSAFNNYGYELGFYFSEDSNFYYSHKDLNNGEDHFGFYTNTNPFGSYDISLYMTDFNLGLQQNIFEITVDDIAIGGTFGLMDGGIATTSVPIQVAEPNILFLFGMFLLGFIIFKRKQQM